MNVFEGAFTDAALIDMAAASSDLTPDQKRIIEENTWDEVQSAVDQNVITREEADQFLYNAHNRIQHLGNTVLQAS